MSPRRDTRRAIELNSFQWGVGRGISTPNANGGREVSAPVVSEATITKSFDSSSVPLIQQAFGGNPTQVETDFVNQVDGKLQPYLKIRLDNTLISSYSMSSGGGLPGESLSLNFTRINIASVNSKGPAQNFTFDLAKLPATLGATTSSQAAPIVAPVAASTAGSGTGGDPILMAYGNIKGDVTDKGFKNDIALNSFQWGVGRSISNATGGGGRVISAPSISEIVVAKNFDSSSVPLIQQALGGDPTNVTIDFANTDAKAKLQLYLEITLKNTLLSGYSMSSGGDLPSESLSLNFTKISFKVVGGKGKNSRFHFNLRKDLSPIATAQAASAASTASTPLTTAASTGSDPIYMKYGDIKGDVTDPGFEGDIKLNSFQWGIGRGITMDANGRRIVSAPSISEIVVTKDFDASSVPLIKEALIGNPTNVEADFVNQVDGKLLPYLKITLGNNLISGYSMSSGGDKPSESLSLNFTKISIASVGMKGKTQNFAFDLAKQAVKLSPVALSQVQALAPASPTSATSAASAGSDPIYMTYGDIKGDVTDPGFEGDIQLNSVQWGVGRSISRPTAGGGRQVSAPNISEVVVTKTFDSSSLPLIEQAFVVDPAHVDLYFANQVDGKLQTYLTLDLANTLESGYSMSSSGDRPSESLSLNFTKIGITSNTAKGPTQKFEFDLAKQPAAQAVTSAALTAPAASSLTTNAAGAGSDPIYMKYGDIKGEVTAEGFTGDIGLTSFQWGVGRGISSPNADGERNVSPTQISEIVVTKGFDSTSIPLIQQAFGNDTAQAGITFADQIKGELVPYLSFNLDNTLISGYSISSGGDNPSESLSLNFTKISITSNVGGTTQTFIYDLASDKALLV